MKFRQISAPIGLRLGINLSADNGRPDRFTIIDAVRKAGAALGLKAPAIATLDALLSCLPPDRNHDVVFASNATLAFRRNGIADRTLRRHVAQLIELGLLTRSDSPNRKRYTKHDPVTGGILRFGFDLGPVFLKFAALLELAHDSDTKANQISFLRTKLRVTIARTLEVNPDNEDARQAQRAIRRNLDAQQLQEFIKTLQPLQSEQLFEGTDVCGNTVQLAATDGQNVRHHHKSKKELIDSEDAQNVCTGNSSQNNVTLEALIDACPEAAGYLLREIRTQADVVAHARTLAPMMGIDRAAYAAAENRFGPMGAAISIWGLLQLHKQIRQLGAYFRSLTSGKHSDTFDPWLLIKRLATRQQGANVGSCSGTISAYPA